MRKNNVEAARKYFIEATSTLAYGFAYRIIQGTKYWKYESLKFFVIYIYF